MMKHKASRLTVAVLAAAAVIVVAGSVATASNMGMKLNKALVTPLAGTRSGDNWVSIPYNNPYYSAANCTTAAGVSCLNDFCVKTGLPLGTTFIDVPDQCSGLPSHIACGTTAAKSTALLQAAATAPCIAQPVGVKVRGTAVPASIIIVGSHSSQQLHIEPTDPAALSPEKGAYWFPVPYHTTAVTANDLCTQAGLALGFGTVDTVSASALVPTHVTCGSNAAKTTNLRLGEAARLRDSHVPFPGGLNFTPAHF